MDEAIWGLYKSQRVFIVKTPIVGDKSKTKSNWYKARREILVPRTDQSRDRTDTSLSRVSNDVIRLSYASLMALTRHQLRNSRQMSEAQGQVQWRTEHLTVVVQAPAPR